MAISLFNAVKSSLLTNCLRTTTTTSSLVTRGYKKDPDKGKCVYGELMPKMPIYRNFQEGKRESDPDALVRYYRLHWGGWIRTKAGRRKKLWRKPWSTRWWQRQHILLDDRQANNLEKMITPEYKKQRFVVDDLYEPYHKRHDFDCVPRGQTRVGKSYLQLMWEY